MARTSGTETPSPMAMPFILLDDDEDEELDDPSGLVPGCVEITVCHIVDTTAFVTSVPPAVGDADCVAG